MKEIFESRKQARLLAKQQNIKVKEALKLIARSHGFSSWKSYKDSIDTFWYKGSSAFLNHWFAHYDEAKNFLKSSGGYLLTYKGQYFVATSDYIEYLGFDPEHSIWQVVNFDVSTSASLEKVYNYYLKPEKLCE